MEDKQVKQIMTAVIMAASLVADAISRSVLPPSFQDFSQNGTVEDAAKIMKLIIEKTDHE